ncbi:MAG: DUF1501 domain-containing protein, partial [Nitrospirae bacterium]|nr:DUF1501 domain-containing protein [Nitrospirota bacterium]
LKTVSDAVAAFIEDLEMLGFADRAVVMTASEFGRRVKENGSGTDHGAAAPLFLFGNAIAGGIYGAEPNLSDLDSAGNLKYTIDFRQVYATMLNKWLALSESETAGILNGSFEPLPIIKS